MPVYLCQPGSAAAEPWRHGIQVYAAPFTMDSSPDEKLKTADPPEGGASLERSTEGLRQHHDVDSAAANRNSTISQTASGSEEARTTTGHVTTTAGLPIRRVRHSEVVLVDDVCIAFDRYWLRLRWPGSRGGFAGYIALGKVSEEPNWLMKDTFPSTAPLEIHHVDDNDGSLDPQGSEDDDRVVGDDMDNDDPTRDDEPQDNASTRSSEPFESTSALTCLRTGLIFPSSKAMKLLPVYDDGISPTVTSAPLPSEPVFCRICREGLHEDADDDQPSPAMANEGEEPNAVNRGDSMISSQGEDATSIISPQPDGFEDDEEPVASEPSMHQLSKGPILPHPTYHPNQNAAENPMLAPCECSGSMAFVHYLCVEQWRCRSRHPDAKHGLQCETCGKPYALPPPSTRPTNPMQMDNEDWLEAMPPHVMAALRQPHIYWRVGAAVVRRRWLRPIAPVIMSPIVALYCRARRLLKKKGVARRRWACSLCRRRARWKCVRCLRSYYCSRQCQNVSWHIVHKHVCYKPSRWFWSLLLYGLLTLYMFPGILRDPMMYDLGLGFVPVSFYIMAILAGGGATLLKKGAGIDMRGRTLEMFVVILTTWLVVVSWGLVSAFFGDPSGCHGIFGGYAISRDAEHFSGLLYALQTLILKPAEKWFLMWDRLASHSGPWLKKALCMEQETGCFEHLPLANAAFFFEEDGGAKCAADLSMVSWLFGLAIVVAAGTHFWKQRERNNRRRPRFAAQPRGLAPRRGHAHQD